MNRGHRYAETQVLTASPERLLVLLLRACRRHLASAATALEQDDPDAAKEPLEKSSEIVFELTRTLDPRQSKELAESLTDLYTNVSARLLRAMTTNDATHVREAEALFSPIADAFEDVIEQLAAEGQHG